MYKGSYDVPRSYREAAERFEGARWCSSIGDHGVKLANNTYLIRTNEVVKNHQAESSDFGMLLHSTVVFVWGKDGTFELNSGGWHTQLTKERIGWALDGSMWRLHSEVGVWTVVYVGCEPVVRDSTRCRVEGYRRHLCRECNGAGTSARWLRGGYRDGPCGPCGGTGRLHRCECHEQEHTGGPHGCWTCGCRWVRPDRRSYGFEDGMILDGDRVSVPGCLPWPANGDELIAEARRERARDYRERRRQAGGAPLSYHGRRQARQVRERQVRELGGLVTDRVQRYQAVPVVEDGVDYQRSGHGYSEAVDLIVQHGEKRSTLQVVSSTAARAFECELGKVLRVSREVAVEAAMVAATRDGLAVEVR
jgi:hypothetical protein